MTYLQILDSTYGTVQDGDELYAKFMELFQDAGEKPSAYLQRLQVALNLAAKRGGVLATELDRHLLNQLSWLLGQHAYIRTPAQAAQVSSPIFC